MQPTPRRFTQGVRSATLAVPQRVAQRGYYTLPGAAAGLKRRVETISRHVLPGSVLDVGCNDGSITRELLRAGRVTKAQGVDLEILHDHFPVLTGDLLDMSLASLSEFESVLYLNVHHHLIASTAGTARQDRPNRILNHLLGRCRRMIFEMGSTTENGAWNWLKILRTQYGNDEAVIRSIFGDRMYFEILRYPMQGGVRRMLLIFGNAPDAWSVSQVQWYARNVAAHPLKKRLALIDDPQAFPPGPVGHAPYDWMPSVKFVSFRYGGKRYFGKRHARDQYNVALTLRIYEALRHTRFAPRVVQPLYFSVKYGIVWEYDPELMMAPFGDATVVHASQIADKRFGLHRKVDRDKITALADFPLTISGTTKPVREWCDFQTIRTSRGLRFIDFDAF